jgi:hypothetical protein
MLFRLTVISFVSALVAGCQSPYSTFYTKTVTDEQTELLLPFSGKTEIFSVPSAELKNSAAVLSNRGYAMLGYSSFEANAGDYSSSLKAMAKNVGADVVVIASEDAGTMSGVMPLVSYSPGQTATTYSSGQANAYATSGMRSATATANYSGISTTTTSGTYSTSYVPYQVRRASFAAGYFRKSRFIFGGSVENLSEAEWAAAGRNAGVRVTALVERSPAFLANVLIGDILLTIDGETIYSESHFRELTRSKAGRTVRISALRRGALVDIDVQLNAASVAAKVSVAGNTTGP